MRLLTSPRLASPRREANQGRAEWPARRYRPSAAIGSGARTLSSPADAAPVTSGDLSRQNPPRSISNLKRWQRRGPVTQRRGSTTPTTRRQTSRAAESPVSPQLGSARLDPARLLAGDNACSNLIASRFRISEGLREELSPPPSLQLFLSILKLLSHTILMQHFKKCFSSGVGDVWLMFPGCAGRFPGAQLLPFPTSRTVKERTGFFSFW